MPCDLSNGTIANALESPGRSFLLFETFLTPIPRETMYKFNNIR